MTIPKIFTLDDINKVISTPEFELKLIDAMQTGFVSLENGDFFACPIQTMGLPPFPFVEIDGYASQTCVKSGYFKGGKYYVIKVASGGFPQENSGLMQVFSQQTGKLEALLLDNGILTEVRTAAVGALSTKLLAPREITCIGIIGTGIQARFQLGMLASVTSCRKVRVWGRSEDKAKVFQQEMRAKGWEVAVVKKADELFDECNLIVTTTCAREPVLGEAALDKLKDRKYGLHITCIGADAPGKIELDPNLVAQADLLVADTVSQSVERGEYEQAVKDGLVQESKIVPLGKFIGSPEEHRKQDDVRLTIFDSSGVALQDCIVAQMTYDALKDLKYMVN
ncbi:unnamed protein product [Cylindrotheca closterium]|uniref:Thiomorpholine-carboxylate dehydrogenase n=1 Tax=Cylindrotheca closterium TaxID=2856 RepID=A0AAD2CQ81_9STRA|nr:unnamed protein product [Cylindrotheca closterium]